MNGIRRHLAQPPISRRGAVLTATVLTVVAVVHLIDGPATLNDQFYIGALELSLAVACIPLAILLIIDPMRDLWIAVVGLTTGLPGATDDIGNWKETLGILNMATELIVIVIATRAVVVHRGKR
jgi:hypothetical protein